MDSARDICQRQMGFPIRTPPDQSLFASSPRLFAGYHVLHRLLPPRHPPCALSRLTIQPRTLRGRRSADIRNASRRTFVRRRRLPRSHRIVKEPSPRDCEALGTRYPGCRGLDSHRRPSGGAREDRTPDLLRARQALSQLSYGPVPARASTSWWVWLELNQRPHPYQGCALTD
jgi:hypothetical protein